MVSDRTTDRLFLYHGGVPGLGPGDLIEPGHPQGPSRRKRDAGLGRVRPPTRNADLVHLTTSRIYAAAYAHNYPHGDLYRVEPVGVVEASGEDGPETYMAPAARVIAAVDRAVTLTASEQRRAVRVTDAAWDSFRSSVKHIDAEEAERLTAQGLYYGGRPGLDAGANLGPDASLTNSPRWAVGAAERWPNGDLYRVEPVGPLACRQRGALIVCAARAAVVTSVLSRGHRKPGDDESRPGDGWLDCACGGMHWGVHGAAGLLLFRDGEDGREVVLQHRALWSDQGGTWGVPGGALREGEDPVSGALREAAEEAGVDPAGVEVFSTHVLDHGPWSYTTVLGRVTGPQDPRPTDAESLEIAWVDVDDVDDRPLLAAFADAWQGLRELIDSAGGTLPQLTSEAC